MTIPDLFRNDVCTLTYDLHDLSSSKIHHILIAEKLCTSILQKAVIGIASAYIILSHRLLEIAEAEQL